MKNIALHPDKYGINLDAVKKNHIKKEKKSCTTIQNILNLIKEGCLDGEDNQTIIITSAFHQPRVTKFVELINHYFPKFVGKENEFNIIVKGDERVSASIIELKLREKYEQILLKTFIHKDQVRFANELKNVFKKSGFQLKLLLQADEINLESLYDNNQNKLNLSLMHVDHKSVDNNFIKLLISFLKQNKTKCLDLSGNNFGDEVICKLIEQLIINKIKLETFNLDSNQLTEKSFTAITELLQSKYCPCNLNLGNNKIGQDVERISKLNVGQLNRLSLFGNNITDKWLAAFLDQIQQSDIRELDLHECFKGIKSKIKTVAVLKEFVKKHRKLTYLNVADCGFTDEMMKEIHEVLPKLTTFYVYGNALTIEGVKWLSKAIEKLGSKLTSASWFGYKVPANQEKRQELNKLSYNKISAALKKNLENKQSNAKFQSEKQLPDVLPIPENQMLQPTGNI